MTDTVADNIPEEQKPVEAIPREEVKQEGEEEKMVPLSALQKERKKKQEIERENRILRDYQLKQAQQQEPDYSQQEPVNREELASTLQQFAKTTREETWRAQNPDKMEVIEEHLEDLLKQRPHLAAAIKASPNSYEEAWELVKGNIQPKRREAPPRQERQAPNSPAGVSKSAAMGEAIDVMKMSDAEFNAWRAAKRQHR